MRRRSFLRLADLTNEEFDARVRRRQLPFFANPGKRTKGQANYTPFDAFLVTTAEDFAGRNFLPDLASGDRNSHRGDLENIAWLIRNHAGSLKKNWQRIANENAEFFMGKIRVPADDGLGMVDLLVLGTMPEITSALLEHGERAIGKIIIMSVSAAWRQVVERATGDDDEEPIDLSDIFGTNP